MKILLLAISLTVLTVMMHSISTYAAIAYCRSWLSVTVPRPWMRIVGIMAALVIWLLIIHLAEASFWATALLWWEALPDFPTALYYSLTSYSTVGYGDVVLPDWARLLGPIESVVGVLMLGWSTAVIVAVMQRVFLETPRIASSPATRFDSSGDTSERESQAPASPRDP